ncbi:MAG TPA: anaerobic ribonucleoside-triphosphate reductase [Bacilli bacterium]|nr:anaerobic ribonucleoside-triphosphate reductase [Bacilli bacterium]
MKNEKVEIEKIETKENEKKIGEGVGFERIRRITGYLVGTVDRFNNGKKAEEHDRVKHSMN